MSRPSTRHRAPCTSLGCHQEKAKLISSSYLRSRSRLALNAFEKLSKLGNPQSHSYALCGIKKLDPQRFKELRASIAKSADEVLVTRGCIVCHEAVQNVVPQIDQGRFRFSEKHCHTNPGLARNRFRSAISIRPMHLFGHNRDHDYYFRLLREEERDAQSISRCSSCTPSPVPSGPACEPNFFPCS